MMHGRTIVNCSSKRGGSSNRQGRATYYVYIHVHKCSVCTLQEVNKHESALGMQVSDDARSSFRLAFII